MNKNRLRSRKTFHIVFSLILAALYAFWLERGQMLIVGVIIFVLVSIIEIGKFVFTDFSFFKICRYLMKENEVRSVTSLFWTVLLYICLLIWLPKEGVLYVLLITGLADPVASLIGVKYGKRKLFGRKTVVGSVAFAVVAFFTRHLPYTSTVSIFTAAFFVSSLLVYQKLIRSKIYWIFISIMFMPFLMVNYFLTSLPVVTYNPEAFSNIRITTIPLEDFFYSFSMLSFNLLVYRFMLEKWQKT